MAKTKSNPKTADRPPKKKGDGPTSLRIRPPELADIAAEAKKQNRAEHWIAVEALKIGLAVMKEDKAA